MLHLNIYTLVPCLNSNMRGRLKKKKKQACGKHSTKEITMMEETNKQKKKKEAVNDSLTHLHLSIDNSKKEAPLFPPLSVDPRTNNE